MSQSQLTTLLLSHDNPCNTVFTDSVTGDTIYTVKTEHEPKTVTRIWNQDDSEIASTEWREVRSDIITLGTGKPVSASAWLKKSMVPFKDTVTFQDGKGGKFKWKGNGPGLSFELYCETDKRNPIAKFHKSHKATTNGKVSASPAKMVLDERGVEIQDLVIVSFLFLERTRRGQEVSTANRADVEAAGALVNGVGVGA